jgi:hypothetical protein
VKMIGLSGMRGDIRWLATHCDASREALSACRNIW